ncbi:hypothetical protein T12_14120 [Trichinella patagoniensis]|uniref:Uncharacterized protein n=1 Tax=Trichinella patagoniensis TaxID=990121 RepID=A0A0V0Z542_9BILA|nr:hypothetical protein T12_14120 [Trichinella patagoniensis]
MGNMTGCSIWPACCQHPELDPSRYVAALSLNDRFYLYPQQAYYLLMSVGIPYVQFYGAFIYSDITPVFTSNLDKFFFTVLAAVVG